LHMPTVLREGPYRFFFYSADSVEPPHVHVERDAKKAKFWLAPVRLARKSTLKKAEINLIEELVKENSAMLLGKWNEHFEGTCA
jgi:hypothetical protein